MRAKGRNIDENVVTFDAVPAATKQTMRKSAHMPESRNNPLSPEKSVCAEGAHTFLAGHCRVTTFWPVVRLFDFSRCPCRDSTNCYDFFVNVTTLSHVSKCHDRAHAQTTSTRNAYMTRNVTYPQGIWFVSDPDRVPSGPSAQPNNGAQREDASFVVAFFAFTRGAARPFPREIARKCPCGAQLSTRSAGIAEKKRLANS